MRFDRSKAARMIGMVATLAAFGWSGVLTAQGPGPAKVSPEQAKADRIVTELVEGHNKERAKASLAPLKLESHLVEAAKAHAKDMAEHEVMTHDGTDGSNPAVRVARAGYHYLFTGENVAKGYRTVPEVMQVWMESPPHKKNILDGEYTEIGVAVAYGEYGKPYWCAEFGKPIPKFEPATAAADLVKRINDERTVAKKPLMTIDTRLAKAAQEQAEKLAKARSQGGGTANFDGIDKNLFPDTAVSTSAGHPDAESLVKAVLEKQSLKDQILGKYARIGTGYATAEDGTPYWCLILANPSRR
jgi:uncharacterized protein YkwD